MVCNQWVDVMTMVKIITRLVGVVFLTCSMMTSAADVNYFFCKKGHKNASEEAYVVDYGAKYIYQVAYRPVEAAVKVTRFRLLEILEHNIRGVVYEEYSGDYLLGGGAFLPLPRSSIRKMISLDMTKGVLMKLYTGAGDKFGACKPDAVDVSDIESLLKKNGLIIKNNVINN